MNYTNVFVFVFNFIIKKSKHQYTEVFIETRYLNEMVNFSGLKKGKERNFSHIF